MAENRGDATHLCVASDRSESARVEPTVLRPPRFAPALSSLASGHRVGATPGGPDPLRSDVAESPILDRLAQMAISASRVTDLETIPGEILVDIDAETWSSVTAPGYLRLFLAGHGHDGTVAVVLTRFLVDHGVIVPDLLDHAFVEARALPAWDESEATRTQPGFRTEGSSMQAGTYIGDDATWFCAIRYAAYRRGNVAYLLHATGTAPAREGAAFRRAIAAVVGSVRFDD
ncbi:LpqN/LpqT family lipoprotein [Gordonia sp. LSe1-13]|uniref:LpqN/LpqT family lipoprotein n=1 Tax=Gordonia sesuvii TaxID=3116777 RepID=A0ABU7MCN9_9ACTN|nr:LpqN/LpqT family lipoprotein [Gordonia sp. LSe1-13]